MYANVVRVPSPVARIVPLAVVLGSAVAVAAQLEPPAGRRVAEQIRDRDQGRDARFDVRMRSFDRRGGLRERSFTLLTLRRAAREDRTLIRFTKPNDIQGTGLLVWKHASAEAERFLFLPALGRVRRIAGGESQESFLGSDFSYEDIGGQDLDAYTYEVLDAGGSAIGPGGAPYACYKLQAKARAAQVAYPTAISLVAKDTFIVMHSEFLDRAGQRRKTLDVRKLAKVQDIWTPLEVAVATDRDGTRTELVFDSARYNVGLSEDDFSRRALERGGP